MYGKNLKGWMLNNLRAIDILKILEVTQEKYTR